MSSNANIRRLFRRLFRRASGLAAFHDDLTGHRYAGNE